jgi:hypothetical protein
MKLQLRCGQVDQKISAIEMATEIKLLILVVQIIFSLAIEFKLQDNDSGVDKSTKKSWPLRWQPKSGHKF